MIVIPRGSSGTEGLTGRVGRSTAETPPVRAPIRDPIAALAARAPPPLECRGPSPPAAKSRNAAAGGGAKGHFGLVARHVPHVDTGDADAGKDAIDAVPVVAVARVRGAPGEPGQDERGDQEDRNRPASPLPACVPTCAHHPDVRIALWHLGLPWRDFH